MSGYLEHAPNLPKASLFNAKNRAYPDVAALAHNYQTFLGSLYGDAGSNFWITTYGTSASAPVVAGLLALVKGHTGKRLGLANPLLYQLADSHPSAFKDITSGSNTCKAGCCGGAGFQATKGWDPVTGLGTLKYHELVSAVAELHSNISVVV